MKRFRFRLARVERLRAGEKREARAVLATAVFEALDCQGQREALEAQYGAVFADGLPTGTGCEAGTLKGLVAWREGLHDSARTAAEAEVAAFAVAATAEQAYSNAFREHRVLERLHERKRERWAEETLRGEQKFLDEIHLLRLVSGRRARSIGKE